MRTESFSQPAGLVLFADQATSCKQGSLLSTLNVLGCASGELQDSRFAPQQQSKGVGCSLTNSS